MANGRYIKGKFFMDVHPPLAKLLIALTAWLAGFDGEFDFKEIGKYDLLFSETEINGIGII
jgi:dolichyl-phosphate-mannose--protein O-mannosyl transferase